MKDRILTGVKPTGDIHLGNYFGAIKPIIEMQNKHKDKNEIFLFVADLHALTNLSDENIDSPDNQDLKDRTKKIIAAFLAFGADPKLMTIYRQSDFPQITELSWIFFCLLNQNYLSIGHAYKDARKKNDNVGLGVYLYPGLMAADILLPGANVVPVGEDQRQHIEITRDIAKKFNRVAHLNKGKENLNNTKGKDFFPEPKECIVESNVVLGTDGKKMSKSYKNTLPIFADEEDVRKRISKIETGSESRGDPINTDSMVCQYLKLFISDNKKYTGIEKKCISGDITYKELKDILFDEYMSYFKDARNTYNKIMSKNNYIEKILESNKKKLIKDFDKKLNEIKEVLGM